MTRTCVATLASLLALLALARGARADRGGPDPTGYEWLDSAETELDSEWVDISTTGTRIHVPLDGQSAGVEIGFDFEFYGETYEHLFVSSSGFLTFEAIGFLNDRNQQCGGVGTAAPNLAIYGFRQLLHAASPHSGGVLHATVEDPERPGMRLSVVTFDRVVHFWRDSTIDEDPVTFQIVLFEGSNDIQINVQESGVLEGASLYEHRLTEMGIENRGGTEGFVICGGPASIPDGYSLRFRRSADVGLYVPNRRYQLNGRTPEGGGGFVDLQLVNHSPVEQHGTVSATSELGWPLTCLPATVVARADGGSVTIRCELDAPEDAQMGEIDEVTVALDVDGELLRAAIDVELSHPIRDWQQVATLPLALAHLEVVSDDRYLYALGGEIDYVAPGRPVASTFRYDPETNEWDDEAMAELPHPVSRGGACLMDGTIYLVGGFVEGELYPADPGWFEELSLNPDLLAYDIGADRWRVGAGPPRGTSWAEVVCDEGSGLIYVIGGWVDDNGNGVVQGSDLTEGMVPAMQVLDTATGDWFDGPPPPVPLAGLAGGLVDGQIVVAGGYVDDRVVSRELWTSYEGTLVFDIATDEWSFGGLILSDKRFGGAVSLDGQLCLVGGSGGWSDQCYSHSRWIRWRNFLSPYRGEAGAAVLGGHVYVVGGARGGSSLHTDLVSRWPGAPLPWTGPDPDADVDGGGDAGSDAGPDGGVDGGSRDADAEEAPDGAPPPTERGEGCSCDASGGSSGGAVPVLLVLLGALLGRRRRRTLVSVGVVSLALGLLGCRERAHPDSGVTGDADQHPVGDADGIGDSGRADAETDAGADADPGQACDLFAALACSDEEKCGLAVRPGHFPEARCVPLPASGAAGPGAPCRQIEDDVLGLYDDCEQGYACLGVSASGPVCHRLCADHDTHQCENAYPNHEGRQSYGICDVRLGDAPVPGLMACSMDAACDPVCRTCPSADDRCKAHYEHVGGAVGAVLIWTCSPYVPFESEDGRTGDPCGFLENCRAGYHCLIDECRPACRLSAAADGDGDAGADGGVEPDGDVAGDPPCEFTLCGAHEGAELEGTCQDPGGWPGFGEATDIGLCLTAD